MGRAQVNLRINSNDTIVDHTWIWRADHGAGVGWDSNTSTNGLVVNGDNVTVYGLFVEHHQQFQVLWNGNGGRTYFYQSEIPYDPPDQASYTSAPGVNGWASYKVADSVTSHEAWGLGIYSVFRHPERRADARHRGSTQARRALSSHDYRCAGRQGGNLERHRRQGRTHVDPASRVAQGDRVSLIAAGQHRRRARPVESWENG